MKKRISLNTFVCALLALLTFASFSAFGADAADAGTPSLAFAAVAKTNLIERELIKKFRHESTWLSRIPSKNQYVNADTIRFNEIGADPKVLINNNTYPIPVSDRTDTSTAISLFKYDTENTRITDDELQGLPYDKPGSVQAQHRETLEEVTQEHALHSLAPVKASEKMPVLETTGADDGTGRRRLTTKDVIKLRQEYNDRKIPKKGRILVMCSDHVSDLLLEDKVLNRQYNNHVAGELITRYYGFDLYEDVYNPQYDKTGTKLAFDSADTGRNASISFHLKTCIKARGSVSIYSALAKGDPQNRETVLGMRLWFLAIPIREEGQGAIIDGIL